MHHAEERGLQRIVNRRRLVQDLHEALLDHLWNIQRQIDAPADAHRDLPQPAFRRAGFQQVAGQQRVQIENGVAVEPDLVRRVHEELDGLFVIENHPCLQHARGIGAVTQREQAIGFQQGEGVALQSAGIP